MKYTWQLAYSLKERCYWNGNNCFKFLKMRKREWADGSSCFHWLSGWFQMAHYCPGKYLESKWPYSICSEYFNTLLTMQAMLTITKRHKLARKMSVIYWSTRMEFEKKAIERTGIHHQMAKMQTGKVNSLSTLWNLSEGGRLLSRCGQTL